MMKRNFKGKRNIIFIILLLCAGVALAYVASNFELHRFIVSFSGGGTVGSEEYEMKTAAGESMAGSSASEDYTASAGFLTGGAPTTLEEPDDRPTYPYVYPNPCRPGSGGEYDADRLTFANMPEDMEEIKILNIAGELVNTISEQTSGGKIKWEPVNKSGRRLASGVYIYYVTGSSGKTVSGKFSIIY